MKPLAALVAGVMLATATLAACGRARSWDVHGTVRGVQPETAQVLIEHEEIPGLMPGMTMNFDVSDPALLGGVEAGQAVVFRLVQDDRGYRITALQVVGEGEAGSSGVSLDAGPGLALPAPDFALTDQEGRPLALADLRGRVVLLDFIFTHCPGPCPVLTGILRDVQQLLPAELRERAHFVSITLDPERDTPDVLRAYAGHRGIDTSDWSLLTGSPDAIADVLRSYGVASQRGDGGDLQHLVVTFLIDPEGRIAKRYLGTQHTPAELVKDLERILS